MNRFFNHKVTKQKLCWQKAPYTIDEFQCPICKMWFTSYAGHAGNVLQHITIIGKRELVAKALGELKETPHWKFYKKYTKPCQVYVKQRYWTL